MNDLQDILNKCLNTDRSTRQEGEAFIDQLATNNFGALLQDCAVFLSDESKQVQLRQLCATLIKNLILNVHKHHGKWDLLPLDTKANIKSYTLSCLASTFKEIRKAAGLTVAGNIYLT
jgi:hypothetical protein